LFNKVLRRFGFGFDFIDTTHPEKVARALAPSTRLVWLETPTNPYLRVNDIRVVKEVVHGHPDKPLLIVDNTFATPYLQHPLELGADIEIHSTTKYFGGHSDVVGSAIVVKDNRLYEKLVFLQNAVGAVPGSLDCFLVLQGIKTLPVCMNRHAENAAVIVEFLEKHPKVEKIFYPFHSSHLQNKIAGQQMKNGGGMVSFIKREGGEAAIRMAEVTRIFTLAESLGGVESLIEVPAAMTHLSVAGSPLEVDAGLVRLSIGLEHKEDLLEDIQQALKKA
jgi:cystathionine gamma-synthase